MAFQDLFSGHASAYARARPVYPPELFSSLASLTPRRDLAWDVGTGNGQAARGLACHFSQVLATDASGSQLAEAIPDPRITYREAREADSGLPDRTADLIAVAQAAHWFDLDAFYREALRVLRPGGVLALWCYGLCQITPEIDAVVNRFYAETVGPWWSPERRHVEAGYRTFPFPLPETPFPDCEMVHEWGLAEFIDYIGTWSAVAGYRKARGSDPMPQLAEDLQALWSEPPASPHKVRWKLSGRLGRLSHQ
jgi:SAM-dependent methyltransferase